MSNSKRNDIIIKLDNMICLLEKAINLTTNSAVKVGGANDNTIGDFLNMLKMFKNKLNNKVVPITNPTNNQSVQLNNSSPPPPIDLDWDIDILINTPIETPTETIINNLPNDIILDIIKKLDVKDAINFLAVSKEINKFQLQIALDRYPYNININEQIILFIKNISKFIKDNSYSGILKISTNDFYTTVNTDKHMRITIKYPTKMPDKISIYLNNFIKQVDEKDRHKSYFEINNLDFTNFNQYIKIVHLIPPINISFMSNTANSFSDRLFINQVIDKLLYFFFIENKKVIYNRADNTTTVETAKTAYPRAVANPTVKKGDLRPGFNPKDQKTPWRGGVNGEDANICPMLEKDLEELEELKKAIIKFNNISENKLIGGKAKVVKPKAAKPKAVKSKTAKSKATKS
jgi:hypothetical protein